MASALLSFSRRSASSSTMAEVEPLDPAEVEFVGVHVREEQP